MKVIFKLSIYLVIVICFFLCCIPSVYIKTQSDPEFDFKNKNTIVVYADNKLIEDKKFKSFLQSELKAIGLTVIDGTDDAQISTCFNIYEDNGQFSGNLILPKTTTTTGRVGNIDYSERSSTTQIVPYTTNYSFKKVHIKFYSKEDNSIVWDCFFSIESKYYNENVNKCLKNALSKYGTDFEGSMSIY